MDKNVVGWLIYDAVRYSKNRWFAKHLVECAAALGHELRLVIVEELEYGIKDGNPAFFIDKQRRQAPDYAIVRTERYLLSLLLESAGSHVFNSPEVSLIANDKRLAYMRAMSSGLPVMNTSFVSGDGFLSTKICASDILVCTHPRGHGGSEVKSLPRIAL